MELLFSSFTGVFKSYISFSLLLEKREHLDSTLNVMNKGNYADSCSWTFLTETDRV